MKRIAYPVVLVLSIAAAFLAGSFYHERKATGEPRIGGESAAATYICPMHPTFASDRPGDCPICGMALVAASSRDSTVRTAGTLDAPPGSIRLSVERQQLAGVQVAAATISNEGHALRLVGRVAADEALTWTVNAGIDGFVRDVSAAATGSPVRRNQVLATFSSPEAIPVLQAYIVALNAMDHLKQRGEDGSSQAQIVSTSSNFQQRTEKLLDLGMSELQVKEIEQTHEVPKSIRVLAPGDGVILSRTISRGQRFSRGSEWYRIADLRRVWVEADVFDMDADQVKAGAAARISLPGRQHKFDARVSEVLPQVDPVSRVFKVRLEVDNAALLLRPDMFVDVELQVASPAALVVPADAVIDTGLRRVVFVEREAGTFEPRPVETGWRLDGRVQILSGLAAGDRVVAAGAFLLASESRMQLPADRPPAALLADAICGMKVDEREARAAGLTSVHAGHTYVFCSLRCKQEFDKAPSDRIRSGTATALHKHPEVGGRP